MTAEYVRMAIALLAASDALKGIRDDPFDALGRAKEGLSGIEQIIQFSDETTKTALAELKKEFPNREALQMLHVD